MRAVWGWLAVVGLIGAGVVGAVSLLDRQPPSDEFCRAQVGDRVARLDLEQARWTSLMVAISNARGLPPRAATIAIATAYQESRIHNIDYGDRDSLGLFQQRPSQGWGTPEQIMDPVYSINRFYDGLVEVRDYTSLPITEAAQAVQRSAFPAAYAAHEDYARALASSLRGYSPAQFGCQIDAADDGDPDDVVDELTSVFDGVQADADGRSLRLPVADARAEANVAGWAWAHYLVANAGRLDIGSVSFDAYTWTAGERLSDGSTGWVVDDAARADVVSVMVGTPPESGSP